MCSSIRRGAARRRRIAADSCVSDIVDSAARSSIRFNVRTKTSVGDGAAEDGVPRRRRLGNIGDASIDGFSKRFAKQVFYDLQTPYIRFDEWRTAEHTMWEQGGARSRAQVVIIG
ncbi:hypothetical protein EVAR_17009_1 [Eumeta japonica]|uniref:Uncharacterized protein n=1 Tax=Eumeta variegata TaxID=151549 RepID=A0A4C1TVJ7_EUMVA|nr:hypothetical protein EVAR_17009_1 [Eumeta japonica]